MRTVRAYIENVPADYIDTGIMIASDETRLGEIDQAVAQMLLYNRAIADYPGEDFYAYIWFQDKLFVSEVWKEHAIVGLLYNETIEGLIQEIRNAHGERMH